MFCHLQPMLPGSQHKPWLKNYDYEYEQACKNKMFYETHFVVHSPWAVWIAAQSSLFTLERKPEPELGSIHGKASEPERRAREREKERVSQSVILVKTPLETPPTCVRLCDPFAAGLSCKTGKVVLNSQIPKAYFKANPNSVLKYAVFSKSIFVKWQHVLMQGREISNQCRRSLCWKVWMTDYDRPHFTISSGPSQNMGGEVIQDSITQIWFRLFSTNPITIIFITPLIQIWIY